MEKIPNRSSTEEGVAVSGSILWVTWPRTAQLNEQLYKATVGHPGNKESCRLSGRHKDRYRPGGTTTSLTLTAIPALQPVAGTQNHNDVSTQLRKKPSLPCFCTGVCLLHSHTAVLSFLWVMCCCEPQLLYLYWDGRLTDLSRLEPCARQHTGRDNLVSGLSVLLPFLILEEDMDPVLSGTGCPWPKA